MDTICSSVAGARSRLCTSLIAQAAGKMDALRARDDFQQLLAVDAQLTKTLMLVCRQTHHLRVRLVHGSELV